MLDMVFSRETNLQHELGRKIRQAKTLAKNNDVEFKLHHNDEVKDAQQGNYTKLIARITKEHNDNVARVYKYRETHWK
jgi:hypothetical protein